MISSESGDEELARKQRKGEKGLLYTEHTRMKVPSRKGVLGPEARSFLYIPETPHETSSESGDEELARKQRKGEKEFLFTEHTRMKVPSRKGVLGPDARSPSYTTETSETTSSESSDEELARKQRKDLLGLLYKEHTRRLVPSKEKPLGVDERSPSYIPKTPHETSSESGNAELTRKTREGEKGLLDTEQTQLRVRRVRDGIHKIPFGYRYMSWLITPLLAAGRSVVHPGIPVVRNVIGSKLFDNLVELFRGFEGDEIIFTGGIVPGNILQQVHRKFVNDEEYCQAIELLNVVHGVGGDSVIIEKNKQ